MATIEKAIAELGKANGHPNSGSALKSLSVQSAWLGDPETLEVAPATQFKGQKHRATWLPGPETAGAWQTYLQTGQVKSSGRDES